MELIFYLLTFGAHVHTFKLDKGSHVDARDPVIQFSSAVQLNIEKLSNESLKLKESTYKLYNLFSSINTQTVPLHLCNYRTANNFFSKIPPQTNCEPQNKSTTEVALNFWYPNTNTLKAKAYFCQHIEYSQSGNFFNEYKTKSTALKIKAEECRNLVDSKIAPNGFPVKKMFKGFFSTNRSHDLGISHIFGAVSIIDDFYYQETEVDLNDQDDTIMSHIPMEEQCDYKRGYCTVVKGGLVIWNPEHFLSVCRLENRKSDTCTMRGGTTSSVIFCPTLNITISKLSAYTICNVTIINSEQKIWFTSDITGQVLNGTINTLELQKKVTQSYNSIFKTRKQRDSPTKTYNKDFTVSSLKDALIFLHQLQSGTGTTYQVCISNLVMLETIRLKAQAGLSKQIIRPILSNESYKGTLVGDMINFYLCDKIYEYRFLDQEPNDCYKEWPISFIYNNKTLKAYVESIGSRISYETTKIPCDSIRFVFMSQFGTLELKTKPKIADVPNQQETPEISMNDWPHDCPKEKNTNDGCTKIFCRWSSTLKTVLTVLIIVSIIGVIIKINLVGMLCWLFTP